MKKSLVSLITSTLLIFLSCCGLAVAQDSPQLLNIKHSILSANTEVVVLQLNGSYTPKTFTLKDGNPRIIFDFAAMTLGKAVKNTTSVNGPFVQRVRVGVHSGDVPKTRIVFDVNTLKGVTFTQHFDEQSSSLIVRLTGPDTAAAPPKQDSKTEAAAKASGKETEKSSAAAKPEKADKAPQQPATPPPPAPAVEKSAPAAAAVPPAPSSASTGKVETAPQAKSTPPEKKSEAAPQKETAATPAEKKEKEQTVPTTPAAEPVKDTTAAKETKDKKAAVPVTDSQKDATTAAKAADKEPAQVQKAAAPVTDSQKDATTAAKAADKEPTQAKKAAAPVQPAAEPADKTATTSPKPASALKTADNPELEYVKFDPSSPKGEMVLFKLNGFHPPAVHGVEEGVPRVICDFNKTKLLDGSKKLIKADGKFVKAIRTSKTKKPDRIRIIVELEPNHSYDLQQVFFKDDNLYALIVNTTKK